MTSPVGALIGVPTAERIKQGTLGSKARRVGIPTRTGPGTSNNCLGGTHAQSETYFADLEARHYR